MTHKELIAAEMVDGKRQFSLTDGGREHLEAIRTEHGDRAHAPWKHAHPGRRGDLRGAMGEIMGQARQIGRFGTEKQLDAAKAVLADTRTKLYAILAESPATEDES